MRIARYDALTRPLTEVVGVLTICLALLAGAYLTINRETYLLGIKMSDEPITLEAFADQYGVSPERVRQIEMRAFQKVQTAVKRRVASEAPVDRTPMSRQQGSRAALN